MKESEACKKEISVQKGRREMLSCRWTIRSSNPQVELRIWCLVLLKEESCLHSPVNRSLGMVSLTGLSHVNHFRLWLVDPKCGWCPRTKCRF